VSFLQVVSEQHPLLPSINWRLRLCMEAPECMEWLPGATFDLEISIRTMFSIPTLEAMAGEIERRTCQP